MAGAVQDRRTQMEMVDNFNSPNSPFYVNPSDNQVSAIVSPELAEGNYCTWKHSFELALSIKNKMGFVDGSIPRPSEEDPLYPVWRRCNNLVKSWIQRSLSVPIASTIFFLDTAREIWEELRERYADPDDSRVCQLQWQYYGLSQGNRLVYAFYNEMLTILRELRIYRPLPHCDCGKCDCNWQKVFSEQYQKDMVFKFLNGLNDSYAGLRTQILMRKPFSTLGEAYNTVQREEIQRNMKQNGVAGYDEIPMMAATIMTDSNQKGSKVKEVSNSVTALANRRGRFELICEYCGKKGHLKAKCYHLNGFPPNDRIGRGRFQSQTKPPQSFGKRLVNMASSTSAGKQHEENTLHPQLSLSEQQVQRLIALLSVED